MKDRIAKFIGGIKLDAVGIMKLYIFVQGLADTLKGVSSAEKKRRAEMAVGHLTASHILRCWRDDARYADFRAGLSSSSLATLTTLADYAQEQTAALFGQ